MYNVCVMMPEIQTIEGGPKRCLLTRGDQIYKKNKKKLKNIFIGSGQGQVEGVTRQVYDLFQEPLEQV